MTLAAKDGFGAARRTASSGPWRRLWQVPLLLAGIGLFGLGLRAFIQTIRPVSFADQSKGLRLLLEGEQFEKAIKEINRLAPHYVRPAEQGELQLLAGDAHYLWQRRQPAFVKENYEQVLDHYGKAVAWGIAPDAGMNERWGESALALGDAKLAVNKLETAIEQDPSLMQTHVRELVSAYAADGHLDKARQILEKLLAEKGETTSEGAHGHEEGGVGGRGETSRSEAVDNRVWALCKQIELAIVGKGGEELAHVLEKAREALKGIPELGPSGRVLTWIGRGELERGRLDQAQLDLSEARVRFISHHIDDGRAAVLLGKIAESKGDLARAAELYGEVAVGHAGTAIWPAARLGRAEVTVKQGLKEHDSELNEQMLGDYRFAIKAVSEKAGEAGAMPELITKETLEAAFVADFERVSDARHYAQALAFLALQAEMGVPETEATAFRLASTKERRADALMAESMKADERLRVQKQGEAREIYAQAAEDYLRHSKLATLQDELSGNSLWKGAQLFDKAGKPLRSIAAYEQFTKERPRDPRQPESLLATGRLYQSAGMMEKALAAYQRNIAEHRTTPAAYTSTVNMARCYMALADAAPDQMASTQPASTQAAATQKDVAQALEKSPKQAAFDQAEEALLSLVQNNTDLLPSANEFRMSLFTLGELYYRNARWADAILRLQEAVDRYPGDSGIARAVFMLAESYRKSALDIATAVKANPAISGREALESARAERLLLAAGLFTHVIEILDADGGAGGEGREKNSSKLSPLENEYVRTSYLDRAGCYFDRGDFARAIKLYDEASTRFSEESAAVQAYVQIVSCYLALKEPTLANSAVERGLWILKRIPDEALAQGNVQFGRAYYERLLALGKN